MAALEILGNPADAVLNVEGKGGGTSRLDVDRGENRDWPTVQISPANENMSSSYWSDLWRPPNTERDGREGDDFNRE
jgi:hypothetical protein